MSLIMTILTNNVNSINFISDNDNSYLISDNDNTHITDKHIHQQPN